MLNELTLAHVAAFAGTYLLHGACWFTVSAAVTRLSRPASHRLRRSLWMAALLLPVLTACGATIRGDSGWVLRGGAYATSIEEPLPLIAVDSEPTVARPVTTPVLPPVNVKIARDNTDRSSLNTGQKSADRSPDQPAKDRGVGVQFSGLAGAEPWSIEVTPSDPSQSLAESLAEPAPIAHETSIGNLAQGPSRIHSPGPSPSWALRFGGWMICLSTLIGLSRFGVRVLATTWWLRGSRPLTTGPAHELLTQLRLQVGMRQPVEVRAHEDCREPAACGVWRATIILPPDVEHLLSRDELRALLAHELAHHVRRDPLWLWLGQIVSHAAWWQPLNLIALRRWRWSAESQCDQWTLGQGVSPITLAKCLTNVAAWRLNASPSPGLAAGGASLTLRIEQLLTVGRVKDVWDSRIRARWVAVTLFTAWTLLAAWGPRLVWQGSVSAHEVAPASRVPLIPRSPDTISVEPVATLPTDELAQQLAAVTDDLDHALQLLAGTESDPEIESAIGLLRSRLDRLRRTALQHEGDASTKPIQSFQPGPSSL